MAPAAELDSVDLEILRLLQNDARITNKELAAAVRIAPSTCLDRVARLRSIGVVLGQTIRVDPERLGRPLDALISLRIQPHRRELVDPFVTHVLGLPETRALYNLAGPDDYLVHVSTAGAGDLQRLVLDAFASRDEVSRVHTTLIFQQWAGGPLLPPGAAPPTSGGRTSGSRSGGRVDTE
ncbi:DNA-binding Lrp family transcriptional regulator [Actinoalloteichus hoggarensis]|uniref:HTH-type transcriptional regulator LrpC n=1 Tax=Actinoalloteichus hoggarensis TaxID=1470176 RepID=A0A221W1D8_9PSEU|nr:Lrp/AsnC family transcriptional regulator [Actinoalloteichus hoggarensis]ASO19550.1 HTH-type transcriptional regulator LrpC [Actinoalloteichus hoggarensis]MBB5919743.1 DNA-binding Lrp family transcriptional regulator [Actinoalloteichus hoggarensis]